MRRVLPALLLLAACHGSRENLWVELTWTTAQPDLDLHVLASTDAEMWDPELDQHYCTSMVDLDWGAPGRDGDPHSEIDDRGGFGPEVIVVQRPVDVVLPVWVHYYSRGSSGGPERATVTIWSGDELVHEAQQDIVYNEVWEVGAFDATTGLFEPADTPLTESSRRQCIEN